MGEIYAKEVGISSPLASPYFGDIDSISNLTIFAGNRDILGYDSLLLEEKFPHIELHYFEGAFHDFPIFPVGKASSKSFKIIVDKIKSLP